MKQCHFSLLVKGLGKDPSVFHFPNVICNFCSLFPILSYFCCKFEHARKI
jgi:hypothetical protein